MQAVQLKIFAFISSPICCLQTPSFGSMKCCFTYIAYWLCTIDTTCSNDKLNVVLFTSILYTGKHQFPVFLFLPPHIKNVTWIKIQELMLFRISSKRVLLYILHCPNTSGIVNNRSLMLQYFSIHKLVILHTECLGMFAISRPCR